LSLTKTRDAVTVFFFFQVVNRKANCQSTGAYNEIWREFQERQMPANIVNA
jgi:hypothetical protein